MLFHQHQNNVVDFTNKRYFLPRIKIHYRKLIRICSFLQKRAEIVSLKFNICRACATCLGQLETYTISDFKQKKRQWRWWWKTFEVILLSANSIFNIKCLTHHICHFVRKFEKIKDQKLQADDRNNKNKI